MRKMLHAAALALALALLPAGGCFTGPKDVSHRDNFRELLAGRCFRCKEDTFYVGDWYRHQLLPKRMARHRSFSVVELPEFRPGRTGYNVTRVPRELAVEFRVTRLLEEPGSTGGNWVEVVFLNGPFAGRTVEATYLFLAPGPQTGSFVIGPEVEYCD